ncbi:MAG TPA: hypothetical protein VHQ94_16070 [Pyrinomonadaceae bacterium]|jgi:hypothetical protein|nr:hypothetical protein [Pyrinomonadaceae bacterium]
MKVTITSILLVALSLFVPGSSAQTGAQRAAAPPQAGQKANDRGWPRGYSLPSEAQMVIYEPQIATWEDQKKLVALTAVSYVAKGAQKPGLGTIKLEADTEVALNERLVKFTNLKIVETNFPTLTKEQTQEIATDIEKNLPDEERVISLDRVLAFVDKSTINPKNVQGLKSDPPRIILTDTPSVLVSFDGEPIWSPIKDNELKYAVNTNWDIFQHQPTGMFYLRNDTTWLRATDLKGYWSRAGKLPDSFSKLPEDENWKDVRANLPGAAAKTLPKVYVTTDPTELIYIEGKPKYVPVPNTGLLWISNTEADLFRMGENGPVYYLVAGRWFTAPGLGGHWTFATPNLPEDFKRISVEHPRSRVLASVPGTQQAAEAVLLAEIPQFARVNKKEITAPEVIYQGDPQYQQISGTALQRAANTDKQIIKVGDNYYMCYQGIWFVSNSPKGPWTIAETVPKDIYNIPPSDPAYSVTYVTVQDDEDSSDDWVTYASYAGYTGLMIGWGCAVWGTGWYYPPYYYGGIYYPYWRTYGYGAWYNPYTGIYGTAGRIYGPYGGVGYGARYNPSTGTYARGAFAYGPYGARGAAQAYNPRTGTYAATRQGSNVYGSWGSTHVQRGDDWVNTKRFTNSSGNTTRVTRGDDGSMISRRGQDGSGFVGTKGDSIYAGRDGNVYRKDGNGGWSKWENGSWNSASRPEQRGSGESVRDSMLSDRGRQTERTERARGERAGQSGQSSPRAGQMDRGTLNSLERDRASRNMGSQRSRDFGNYSRSRSSGSVGSYGGSRGGGGFSRGGGGGGFRGGGRRR